VISRDVPLVVDRYSTRTVRSTHQVRCKSQAKQRKTTRSVETTTTSAAGLLRKLSWRMIHEVALEVEVVVEDVLRGCRETEAETVEETVEDGATVLREGEEVMARTELRS
jgi:hypothetical protein